jgi:hypothetical protein
VELPAVVGVPEIVPVIASIERPVGNVPELIENVYGSAPLVATASNVKAVPDVPESPDVGVVKIGVPVIFADVKEVPVAVPPVLVPVALYLISKSISAEIVVYVSAVAPTIVVQEVVAVAQRSHI